MYRYLYVWLNLNNDTYYYRLLKSSNSSYYIGYINQYNHKLVLFDKIVIEKHSYYNLHYVKQHAMRNLISFLERNL